MGVGVVRVVGAVVWREGWVVDKGDEGGEGDEESEGGDG